MSACDFQTRPDKSRGPHLSKHVQSTCMTHAVSSGWLDVDDARDWRWQHEAAITRAKQAAAITDATARKQQRGAGA